MSNNCDTPSGHCACGAWHGPRVMTPAEWGSQYRAARDALVAIAGEPTVLWASDVGRLRDVPDHGWVHCVTTEGYAADIWYPTEERALAAQELQLGTVMDAEECGACADILVRGGRWVLAPEAER